jgi:glycosyltransferase involved in cell wall biosynthesis
VKLSIITVVYNNVKGIKLALESVISQDYLQIEYIVVDGHSTDGTVEIINQYLDKISVFISEPDKGIYDALNKGILCSSGDVVAILHSDDVFCSTHVCSDIMRYMDKTKAELCFSSLVVVNSLSEKVLRYYMASYFRRWMFRSGWMPPHPTCFIKKHLFNEFGMYSLNYKIAGDFDLLLRFFYGRKIRWSYFDKISVKMSGGGLSNSGWRSKQLIFNEINRSLKSNGIWSLPIFQLGRYFIRFLEVLIRPKRDGCG